MNTARVPGVYLLNDSKRDYWEDWGGPGQLTSVGKEQMYLLGQFFKKHYSFLNSTYSPKRVYVRSIDTDRSLASISAFIYGMYPDLSNHSNEQWSSQSNWVPIPVHTEKLDNDPVIIFFKDKYFLN